MQMTLGDGEPPAGPWRVEPFAELIRLVTATAESPVDRPVLVAIDGRGGSGKTTLGARITNAVEGSVVIHTDDIAWAHSRFGWDDLLVRGVLEPLRRGAAVHYQPPAWSRNGRTGYLDVPPGAPLVIVEGTGASRQGVAHLFDATVWVQADVLDAKHRALARDGRDPAGDDLWDDWMTEEVPFLRADRPWDRATVIVAGASDLPHDPDTEVVLAAGDRR